MMSSTDCHDNDSAKQALLDRWVKVFEKSLASPVPQTLILERPNTIQLEDVQEVVTEEIDIGVGRVFNPPTPQINKPPCHLCPRHGREGRTSLDDRRVKAVKAVLPKSVKKASGNQAIPLKKDDGSLKSTNVAKIPPEPQITSPSKDVEREARKDPFTGTVRCRIDDHLSEAASTGYSSKRQSSSIERIVPDNDGAKEPAKPVVPGGEPITLETAKALRILLFGSPYSSFSTDWRKQHINFFKNKSCALSFFKPGPDGVMACLQGFLLRHLLFEQPSIELVKSMLNPMSSDRQKALIAAMVQILWQAGEQKQATVLLPCGECNWVAMKDYREDQTETLRLYRFNNYIDLERFMKKQLGFFESSSGNGCILLLYSVILSRTISRVIEDLSEPNSTLMGPHDSCSQAMINLLLTGRASQNVFNGDTECTKNGRMLAFPLKGVKSRSEIGFLSIDEHNAADVFAVGSMLKTPKFPVWVVNTGEHYGVLFALNKELVNDWRLERRFDLFFCTGSAKRNHRTDECVFTLDTRDVFNPNDGVDDDEPSNVEHCIRTKWPGAVIERKEILT